MGTISEIHPRVHGNLLDHFYSWRAVAGFGGPDQDRNGQANAFRGIFFVMTLFTIGVMSNFRKLWEEGVVRLALVYVICLFGFIVWIGLLISWLFFQGVKPPVV